MLLSLHFLFLLKNRMYRLTLNCNIRSLNKTIAKTGSQYTAAVASFRKAKACNGLCRRYWFIYLRGVVWYGSLAGDKLSLGALLHAQSPCELPLFLLCWPRRLFSRAKPDGRS